MQPSRTMSKTMTEMRRHRRMNIPMRLQLSHPALGVMELLTRDISDGGVFILLDEGFNLPLFELPLGEKVQVRSLGLGADQNETGEVLTMSIVRQGTDGVGLQLLDQD